MVSNNKWAALAAAAVLLSGCEVLNPPPKPAPPVRINEDPYPSMQQIKGRIAFYPDQVEVYEVEESEVNG